MAKEIHAMVSLREVRKEIEDEKRALMEMRQSYLKRIFELEQWIGRTDLEKQRLRVENESLGRDLFHTRRELALAYQRFSGLPGWCIRMVERFWPKRVDPYG